MYIGNMTGAEHVGAVMSVQSFTSGPGYTQGDIVINANGFFFSDKSRDFGGELSLHARQVRAMVIIHELGHYAGLVSGQAGSVIFDDSQGGSLVNSEWIAHNCFATPRRK